MGKAERSAMRVPRLQFVPAEYSHRRAMRQW
jgi:hypothetical protein